MITTALPHRTWWQQSLLISVIAIVYIHSAGLVGTKILVPAIGWSEGAQPAGEKADTLEGRFARWDSGYYLHIAQSGYRPNGAERAFFPLYPLLSHWVSAGLGLSLLWSGWFVSVACFIATGLVLYHWVLFDYGLQVAQWSLIWFCFFPQSFFFVAFYPEGLFLLTSIAGVYFARRGQFIASGLSIALAGATRPVAFLLAIPFMIEFWQQHNFQWSRYRELGIGALIAPFGTLGYLLFLALQAGKSDAISVYTSNLALEWKMSATWPWMTLSDGIKAALLGTGITADWFSRAMAWQDLTYALLGLALAIWALRYLRLSIAAFFLANMLFFYFNHGPFGYAFDSMPRHVATVFPVYLVLALLTHRLPKLYRWLPITIAIALLGILSAWFASGRWVS